MNKFFRQLTVILTFCAILAVFGAIAYVIHNGQDPEQQLIKLLADENKNIAKALFAPDDDLKSVLIRLINCEKKRILVAIYTFTQKEIAEAFVHAYKRGVEIQVVADQSYGTDRYSKIHHLANNKIPVWVYQSGRR